MIDVESYSRMRYDTVAVRLATLRGALLARASKTRVPELLSAFQPMTKFASHDAERLVLDFVGQAVRDRVGTRAIRNSDSARPRRISNFPQGNRDARRAADATEPSRNWRRLISIRHRHRRRRRRRYRCRCRRLLETNANRTLGNGRAG